MKIAKIIGPILGIIGSLLFWAGISVLVNRPFLPGPDKALSALIHLAENGSLYRHVHASFSRIFLSVLCSFVPAACIGILAGRHQWINHIISPVLYVFHPLPKATFLPVIMLFLGLGEISKIVLISLIIFSQILVTIRDAAKRIAEPLIDSVRSLGASRMNLLCDVIIPALLPDMLSSLRVSSGTAIAVLFFSETFASESGLGYLIMDAWTRIAYAEMYGAIATLSAIGLMIFGFLDFLEWLLCPWLRN
ncbi:MAG: ABC transporter permease [Treponema sp.]|jgi:NitT/TauT family transport system permease protein|nr:ABC transporter permease [Treponema sp.]